MNMIAKAMDLAERAHAAVVNEDGSLGQRRKYTGDPYTVHTRAVADMIASFGFRDAVVAAALCHDVVEDTPVTLDSIRRALGDEAADMVWALTDVPYVKGGPSREERKATDRERLASAGPEVQSIKCADLIDNTNSIAKHDPAFARTYLPEKEKVLRVLTKAHPILLEHAWRALREGQHMLVQHSLNKTGGAVMELTHD